MIEHGSPWAHLSTKTLGYWARMVQGSLMPVRLAAIQQEVSEAKVRRLIDRGDLTAACHVASRRLLVDVSDLMRMRHAGTLGS